MRIPRSAHSDQPWRLHEFTGDFRIEDVWSFRTPGAGPDDFPVLLTALQTAGGFAKQPRAVRFLFAVRWTLGALFGWDKPTTSLGKRVQPIHDRLPSNLRQTVAVPDTSRALFTPVYVLHNESARELANKTCHAVMHLGWVPTGGGAYELRMAILVKPNGRFGRVYMALIAPFRYLIVYPAITRQWERAWRDRTLGGDDSVFEALADPTPRLILDTSFEEDEQTPFQLRRRSIMEHGIHMTRQAITRHLSILERNGLVTTTRSGRYRRLRLDAKPVNEATRWLGKYRTK